MKMSTKEWNALKKAGDTLIILQQNNKQLSSHESFTVNTTLAAFAIILNGAEIV